MTTEQDFRGSPIIGACSWYGLLVKTCSRCHAEKPLEDFYVVKKTGYVHAACKRCTCDAAKAWRDANPEKFRKAIRNNQLQKKYGLTLEEYDALAASQDGRCAICGWKQPSSLNVDHDHETGRVRGLLCTPCNTGLGLFGDNVALLTKATNYLSRR